VGSFGTRGAGSREIERATPSEMRSYASITSRVPLMLKAIRTYWRSGARATISLIP